MSKTGQRNPYNLTTKQLEKTTPCPRCKATGQQNDLRPAGEMICRKCGLGWQAVSFVYKSLHELFPLAEGTVLEQEESESQFCWQGSNLRGTDGHTARYPFGWKWRIVSPPPERLEFNAEVHRSLNNYLFIQLPEDAYEDGTLVQVMMEERR